jgi:uncharacterized protein YqeY
MKMGIMKSMETQERVENDFKTALKSENEVAKRSLRMVLTSIKLAEVEKGERLSESEVIAILQKEIKSLRESIADAEKAGRQDLIAEAEPEIKILEQYTPQSLSEDEIHQLANEAIAEVGASSPGEMGKVMKVLMPRIQGRAEGAHISAVVRSLLSG